MAQTSGPLTNQTFTDSEWRETVGDEPGIHGDLNGSSYAYSLALNSDVVSIGSATQDSIAVVGGFRHKIPANQPEGITVPAATTAARTDLIVLRYDPTWGAAAPGPVRLARVAGTEGGGAPTFDDAPPGVEDFPLWRITRQPGQALSQAGMLRMGAWCGPNLVARGDDPPTNAPLGTRVKMAGGVTYVRVLDAQQSPTWEAEFFKAPDSAPVAYAGSAPAPGYNTYRKTFVGSVTTQGGGSAGIASVTLPGGAFPHGLVSVVPVVASNTGAAENAYILQVGRATLSAVDIRVAQVVNGSPTFVSGVSVPLMVVAEGW